MARDRTKSCNHMPPLLKLSQAALLCTQLLFVALEHCRRHFESVLRVFCHLTPQGRHLRRPGEEDSDVDIEGFEEDDDGKPKTPAPVRKSDLVEGYIFDMGSSMLDVDI